MLRHRAASDADPRLSRSRCSSSLMTPRQLKSPFSCAFVGALSAIAAFLAPVSPAFAQFVRLPDNIASMAIKLPSLGRADSQKTLTLTITFALQHRARLESLLAAQQDSSSRDYQQWLTTEEFRRRFYVTDSQFRDVVQWLTNQGFTVIEGSRDENFVRFRGSVAEVERLFDTTIELFGTGTRFGNVSAPAIPARFDGVIGDVAGLDNLSAVTPVSGVRSQGTQIAPAQSTVSHGSLSIGLSRGAGDPQVIVDGQGPNFGPSDFESFYNTTPLREAGIDGRGSDCIAIVGDSDFLSVPITTFNSTFHLPGSTITKVVTGSNPGITGDEVETLLYLEWAHAVAPAVPIRYYFAQNSIIDPFKSAVSQNACGVISISFAMCGSSASVFTHTVHDIASEATAKGQTILVASGD